MFTFHFVLCFADLGVNHASHTHVNVRYVIVFVIFFLMVCIKGRLSSEVAPRCVGVLEPSFCFSVTRCRWRKAVFFPHFIAVSPPHVTVLTVLAITTIYCPGAEVWGARRGASRVE